MLIIRHIKPVEWYISDLLCEIGLYHCDIHPVKKKIFGKPTVYSLPEKSFKNVDDFTKYMIKLKLC